MKQWGCFRLISYTVAKRIFDLVLAVILLVVFFPLLVILAVLVCRKMGAPVIFKQERPGLEGKIFSLYKFRTMKEMLDEQGKVAGDEERLTEFGRKLRKYSLDELPQLYNVLKGEMSFVGPRPLLVEYLERYTPEQARRHEVKPGITGWAQIKGRNAISWDEKFSYDLWYVDNCNFWLDLKILRLTVSDVLRAEGISSAGSATMPEYLGSKREE